MPMKKNAMLGIGVTLAVLGIFLFAIAYSSYQDSNSNYQSCLKQYVLSYCNSNASIVSWGVPLEIVGGTLTAIGVGLTVILFLGSAESRKATSFS